MVNGFIALIIAYLLGSIPAAYIVTRLATGKDIRQLGGGNVGARNVFREVGRGAGIAVGIFDVGKGAAAVAIAHWLLDAPELFVLGAGLVVVAGHISSDSIGINLFLDQLEKKGVKAFTVSGVERVSRLKKPAKKSTKK